MTNLTTARLQIALSLLLGCLLAAAGPAGAQTASSTFTASSSGTVGAPASSTTTAPIDGSPAPTPVTKAPETINCSGPVKISSMSVTDPSLPPQVVVSLDTRGLSCVGSSTKTVYLNSGQANLTRPLVASDTIQTTFALYPNTAGGYMKARTAMVTLNLTFDTTTGALTSASASIGDFT